MARHINPSSSTNKTIDAIDRKRERERQFMLKKAREMAPELAVALVQRLLVPGLSVTVTVDTRSAKGQLDQIRSEQKRLSERSR